jgi:alkylation response protein AidB-like acyl-CoA dehydrogenase
VPRDLEPQSRRHSLGKRKREDPDVWYLQRRPGRKTIASEALVAAVEKALEAVGGAGFSRAAGLEPLLRDIRAAQFHPLPPKRQLRLTGRLAFGLEPNDEIRTGRAASSRLHRRAHVQSRGTP